MQDEAKDIRCGLILNIAINKSVIYEYIDDIVRRYIEDNEPEEKYELFDDFEFTMCGDNTYEELFMEEFKSKYINSLNTYNNINLHNKRFDIIDNMVNEYINKKWINIVYGVSDN